MSDLFAWLFSRDSMLWIIVMVILFWVTLIFLVRKLYKFALLFAVLFLVSLGVLALGPLGEQFRERISGKREPTFKMLDKQKIDKLRKKIKRKREGSP